jgi:TctA family transporter
MYYSTLRSLPELANLSRQEQDRLLDLCAWESLKHWELWAVIAMAPLLVLGAFALCINVGVSSPLLGLTGFVSIPVMFFSIRLRTHYVRQHIKEHLTVQNEPWNKENPEDGLQPPQI